MGLDYNEAVSIIVAGTSSYLVEFLPIGAFVCGILIAFWVMSELIDLILWVRDRNSGVWDRDGGSESFSDWKEYRRNRARDVFFD